MLKDIPAELKNQAQEYRLKMIEALSDFDDTLAEKFLNEEDPQEEEIHQAVRKATLSLNITPVFMGSAFKNKGVQSALSAVVRYLPNPSEVVNKAYDQAQQEQEIQLSPTKEKPFVGLSALSWTTLVLASSLTCGFIRERSTRGILFIMCERAKKLKCLVLCICMRMKWKTLNRLLAGIIVAFFGIDCASGDTFCSDGTEYTMSSMFVPNAVISMAVEPKERSATGNFSKALQKFSREDPTFRVRRDEESRPNSDFRYGRNCI